MNICKSNVLYAIFSYLFVVCFCLEIQSAEWTPNLNFTFNGEPVPLQRLSLNNTAWHMDQADVLFKAYNYCQGKEDGRETRHPRRNVLTSSLGIILEKDQETRIIYFDANVIYIDGWEVNDIPLPALQKQENIDIRNKFFSLSKCDTLENLKKWGLIKPNAKINNLEFKRTECHSEKTLLLNLLMNVENISKIITDMAPQSAIHGFILNIASLRDVCSDCIKLLGAGSNLRETFLNKLKKKLLDKEHIMSDNANLAILASGMSQYGTQKHNTRSNIPFDIRNHHNCRDHQPIDLILGNGKLYHIANPYYCVNIPADGPKLIKPDAWREWSEGGLK